MHWVRVLALSIPFLAWSSRVPAQVPPCPGFRLVAPMTGTETYLMDENEQVVHTWTSSLPLGLGYYVDRDGTLLRTTLTGTGGEANGLERLALDGTVLWTYAHPDPTVRIHHDIEPLPNGNVLVIAYEEKTEQEAVAAGRNPAFITSGTFTPDHLLEIQPTGPTSGTVVWEWHVFDHVIQDHDPTKANYGNVGQHPELVDINFPPNAVTSPDWNHCNGVEYDPIHDWVVVSMHTQSEIYVIDHGTTTAEAAGHAGGRWGKGGDILYRWGNPRAYRAGTVADQTLFGQHAPTFVQPGHPGQGHLMVFNNNVPTGTAVFELELPLDANDAFVLGPQGRYGPTAPVWSYAAAGFRSPYISSAERLPNGNTLICSGAQRWVFEVDPAGNRVWSYVHPTNLIFQTHFVDRLLWNDTGRFSATTGGQVTLDLIAGTRNALERYLVLASASGTSPGLLVDGFVLPLNRDAVFDFTLLQPNTAPFLTQTFGLLDGRGRATGTFHLPPGSIPPGESLSLRFAYVLLDPTTWMPTRTSHPVVLEITP